MPFEWVTDFLASLALVPNVAEACRQAGITRTAAYQHKAADEHFAKLWDDAIDESTDELIGKVYGRAMVGSDALAIFLLKSHRPKVYGDRLQADLTTAGESMRTIFYLPENGRDVPTTEGDSPAARPADGLDGDSG